MKTKRDFAWAWACHSAIWLVVLMTISAELFPAFKNVLASLTGHHWVSKGVITLVAFVLVAGVFRADREHQNDGSTILRLLLSAILGGFVIFAFYLLHYFGRV